MAATREQIVSHFRGLMPISNWINGNWGLHKDRGFWDVGDSTYINGIPLIIDLDYRSGYLLEIVDRFPEGFDNPVSYLVITLSPDGHDSQWYEESVGTFFDRKVELVDVMIWGVKMIEGLLQDAHDLTSEKP